MTKILKYIFGISLLMVLTTSACTDQFQDLNSDPIGITDEELEADYQHIGAYFPQIQQMIYCNYNWGDGVNWPFQIMQNLNADIFSGYMMTPTVFSGNVNNTTYALVDSWNGSMWNYTYSYMMPAVKSVEDRSQEEYPHFYAVAEILKVLGISRVSAIYGPAIYTKYGESKTGGDYDSEETLYATFFDDLDNSIEILEDFIEENPDATPFAKFDNLFAGDFSMWVKFANSIKLRLAIRISGVKPDLAKEMAEEAVKGGVLTTGEVAEISVSSYTHPLAALSGSWGDIAMSAEMESMLTGYEDPRLEQYFLPSTDATVEAQGYTYKGIRQGIELNDKSVYGSHSLLNIEEDSPAILMTAAEVYFLRAEGALNGWSMDGTAQQLYELGVQASFDQWGVSIGDYLSSDALPAAYVDVKNASNSVAANSAYMNDVSPKWDESADNEKKLQKIITQKWIAMFPEGNEAWTEYRRTGYPKLFPVVVNNSQGVIDSDNGVKRLNFSVDEKTNNPDGYAAAVQMLGGADNGATPLWWDVD